MRLRTMIRTFGLRDGIMMWRTERAVRSWERLRQRRDSLLPRWQVFHGDKPRMSGYRRKR